MAVFRYEASIFDGTEGNRRHLRELALATLRELPRGQRMEVAVACDAMAVHADVTIGPDGTVNGLNVPMHISPAFAAHLMADPEACARFVGGLDRASIPVNYLHLVTVISVVSSVPTMVLEVTPAAHGTATLFVTEAVGVHVHEVNRDGGRVICVCSDDSTYVQKLGESYDVLADPGAYDQDNADGGVEAPTPPALERPWPSPERTAVEPLFPFDAEPPEWL
jgi:hypothetical protein